MPSSLASYCEKYLGSHGGSLQGGLHVEIPFWGDASPLSYYASLGYRNMSATMSWDTTYPAGFGGGIVDQTIRSDIYHSSKGIAFAPFGLVVEPFKSFRWTVNPEFNLFFAKKYEKRQFAITPGLTFLDGSRERVAGEGATPEAYTFNGALRTTLGYEVPLSRVLYAEPQIGALIPLGGVTPYWYAWRIEAGISIHYDLTPRFELIPVNDRIQVPRYVKRELPPRPKLSATISAIGISRNGVESPVLKMAVEEVRSRNAYPLLTYVFFDENSSSIPDRYVQYTSSQQVQREFKGSHVRENIKPLELYREILNLLGSRLRDKRSAKVRLVGTTSNVGLEANKLELARERAQTIKDYLTRVWGIAPNRILIEARLTPEKPSPNTTETGRQENRRVEIIVDEDEVTDPVTVINIERLATPDRIRWLPDITADAGVKRQRVSVLTGNEELMVMTEDGGRTTTTKQWVVTEENIGRFKDSLTLKLEVEDSAGGRFTAYGSIPITIEKNSADKPERIERFSLILFDFDESRIEAKNARLIGKVATTLPTLNAERITIIGHTDETGDAEYNDRLSRQRAEAAKSALERASQEQRLSPPSRILVDGRGSREALFDNTLPEGRFYSRTVNITVEKRK